MTIKFRWRVYVSFEVGGLAMNRAREVTAATEQGAIHEAKKGVLKFFPNAENLRPGRPQCQSLERRRLWRMVEQIEAEAERERRLALAQNLHDQ